MNPGAIRIEPGTAWEAIPLAAEAPSQPVRWLGSDPEPIPLTPWTQLWIADPFADRIGPPNALASALLGFLHLPIQLIAGTAYMTGGRTGTAAPLTDIQQQAFTATLQTLLAMPDYLALHAQAGRLATTWRRPTVERNPRHDRTLP